RCNVPETCSGVAPLDETFQRVELRQSELIIGLGRVAIAVLGTLPELAPIRAAGKHRPVLLRLMAEGCLLLALDIVGTQWHHALDNVWIPLFPRSPIEPDLKLLSPGAGLANCLEDGLSAHPMSAVRVRHFSGDINLKRLNTLKQCDNIGN